MPPSCFHLWLFVWWKQLEGNLEANNERALEKNLQQAGSELLRCSEQKSRRFGRKVATRKDLIGFCFHMEQMTKAGLPVLDALTDLRDSTTQSAFREVIANLITTVEAGKTLSQAMADFPDTFKSVFVSLVAVGEETGELPVVLQKLTESLKWQDELVAKAKSIMIYPAFVGAVVMGVLLFMMLFVVPQMVDFIKEMGHELPIHTVSHDDTDLLHYPGYWKPVGQDVVASIDGSLHLE